MVNNNAKLTEARGTGRPRPNKPTNAKGEEAEESPNNKKEKCGICGEHYNTKKCSKLKQNTDNRPDYWKSMFDK